MKLIQHLMTNILESLNIPKRYVLAVGTIEPRKNLPMLVRAVEQVKSGEDIALSFVGPTWLGRS
jgi:glycosyltransferase involved in cell wall biosynthesis